MKIQELIDKSFSPILDNIDGSYTFIRESAKRKEYIRFNLIPCEICAELQVVYCRYKNQDKKPCSTECKRLYAQSKEKPIAYKGKLYTIDDVPEFIKSKYHNPIRRFVNKTKWEDNDPIRIAKTERAKKRRLELERTKKEREEKRRIYKENYRKNNPDKVRKWSRNAYKRNPMLIRLRNLMRTLARQTKNKNMITIFKDGVDIVAGVKHLNKQAEIICKKYGYKSISEVFKTHEIDHIIPKSLYDINDPVEFAKANHHLNLRLITQFENRSKGDRIRPKDLEIIKTLPENIYPKGTTRNSLVVFRAAVNRNSAIAEHYKLS